MTLGQTLKKLRTDRGLKQIDFAEKMNCNRQKIADWERGKSTPSANDLILIAKYFNVTTDYFLGLSNVKSTNKDIQFVCEYTGLSEDTISELNSLKMELCKPETSDFYFIKGLLEDVIQGVIKNVRITQCGNCGKAFIKHHESAKYCSKYCFDVAKNTPRTELAKAYNKIRSKHYNRVDRETNPEKRKRYEDNYEYLRTSFESIKTKFFAGEYSEEEAINKLNEVDLRLKIDKKEDKK